MSGEQKSESNPPAAPKGLPPRRRGRRGGRGRRRPAPAISDKPVESELPPRGEPPIRLREEMLVRPTPSKPKFESAVPAPIESPREKFRPAPRAARPEGSAISRAVNEVTEIVESLRQSLEQMEEVLELVELAERQKIADEREIESLLRALRQFQSRGERLSRPERRERPNRPPHFERPPESADPENPEPQPMD